MRRDVISGVPQTKRSMAIFKLIISTAVPATTL